MQHTATQQHSNTTSTLPLTEIKEQHAHRHPNTQRRSYTHHYTAHSTCSSPRKKQTTAARAVAAGAYTTAVRHTGSDCNMHDHRARVALVRTMDCQRPPPPPTTHTQHRSPTATRRYHTRVRSAPRHTNTSNQPQKNPTQRCAVTKQPQRDAVQRRARDNTNLQSQYWGTAPYSLRSTQAPAMRAHSTSRV